MKPRVLYVDDDESNLVCVSYALSDQFDLVTANCGDAALEVLGCSVVDAVIVDQRMPGMSGVELCRRIQNTEHAPARLLYTAYADALAASDAINSGRICKLLQKPLTNEELQDAVLRAIREQAWHTTVRDLRTAMCATFHTRAEQAAMARAARALPDSATIELCELLLEGNQESRFDAVRAADEHLHAFFAEHGGPRPIQRAPLGPLTTHTLQVIRSYLPPSCVVAVRGDVSPIVFTDGATFANTLLLLLHGVAREITATIECDEAGEGWLHLNLHPDEPTRVFADALMATFGGEVRSTPEGVRIGFSHWGEMSLPRPASIPGSVDVKVGGLLSDNLGVDVLFVDHSDANRDAFSTSFEMFSVGVCATAQAAMEMVESSPPAVVVADEHMPDMLGTELCAWLRCHHPDVVPIVLTSQGDFKVAQRAAGTARFLLHAPYNSDEIRALLKTCVDEVHEQRAARAEERVAALKEARSAFAKQCDVLAADLAKRVEALQTSADEAGLGDEIAHALRDLDPESLRV